MNTKQQVEEFTTELLERARYVQGNQYPSGSEEYKVYQAGFKSALAMVYIDLTGTPKSKGMLTTLIADTKRADMEQIQCRHDVDGDVCGCCRLNYERIDDTI